MIEVEKIPKNTVGLIKKLQIPKKINFLGPTEQDKMLSTMGHVLLRGRG